MHCHYNERVHRKKQHASSIHDSIQKINIAFIRVFFCESTNSIGIRTFARCDFCHTIGSLSLVIWYSKCCLTVFTFTFAKQQIQSNIIHRTHSRKFWTQITLAPFLSLERLAAASGSMSSRSIVDLHAADQCHFLLRPRDHCVSSPSELQKTMRLHNDCIQCK